MGAVKERMVATVVGFSKGTPRIRNGRYELNGRRCESLGYVAAPSHPDGYFLAMATGFGRWAAECVGGGITVNKAAEIVREKAGYPSVRHCECDGRIERT